MISFRQNSCRLACALALLGSASAWAQAGVDAATCFDIPALPLEDALSRFSSQTNLQMLYDTSLATGRRSAALHACANPHTVLAQMLEGTGLTARFTSGGAVVLYASSGPEVVLAPIHAEATPLIGSQQPSEEALAYAHRVQRELLRALHETELPSPDRYSISLKIWLDPGGRISRAEVLKSSGEPSMDDAVIEAALTVRTAESPPATLLQPIRIQVMGRRP